MRSVRILAFALGLGLLPSLGWAQFGAPLVSTYTLNIILESASGEVLYKEAMKCQTTKRCDSAEKNLLVGGQPRFFAVVSRWDGAQLDYECWFKPNTEEEKRAMILNNRPTGKLLLKSNETAVELLYDTRNGLSWKGQPAFEKGPIAKLRLEVDL